MYQSTSEWLLNAIEPKLDAIRSLSANCKIDLFCGGSSEGGQFGFVLSNVMQQRLAKLGLPVGFDRYPLPLEEAASQSTNLERQ